MYILFLPIPLSLFSLLSSPPFLSPPLCLFPVSHLPPLTPVSLNLTGWPAITSHYEFSLDVFEPASNYNGLKCEAESFPPIKTFTWTRNGIDIDSSFTRYNLTDTTENDLNGSIIITQVTSNDSAIFTCTVADLGSLLRTDVSLSIRLRFKGECVSVIYLPAPLIN